MRASCEHVVLAVPKFCLLLLLCSCQARRCSAREFCSLAHVRPFSGDLSTTAGLDAALAARSFKKEIILSLFTAKHVQVALQFYNSLRALGLGHLLLLSTNAATCTALLGVLPELGCAWSSGGVAVAGLSGFLQLWHLRIATAARVVRRGYNVLVVDTDVIFFRDPYLFLKSPPFTSAQLLTHREPTHAWGLNCGAYYVHNARPDGPVAWFLAEVADRQLRWLEDGGAHLKSLSLDVPCMTWDQELFDAVFVSALMGRPVVGATSWTMCAAQEAASRPMSDMRRLARRHLALFRRAITLAGRREYVAVPPAWSRVVGTNGTVWSSTTLRLPHAGGTWPQDLGGPIFPPQRGAASLAFQAQLREAGGTVPMWPNPEDPLQAQMSAAAASETFALLPDWFVFGWQHRGRRGVWEERAGNEVQQVLGHILYVKVTPNVIAKNMLIKYLGRWNWTLHAMHQGAHLYAASTSMLPAPRLLAYHPSLVRLDETRSYSQLLALMRGLMQAAVATGRAVLWPDLPCDLSRRWDAGGTAAAAAGAGARHAELPMVYAEWLHPYGPLDAPLCFNVTCASGPCLLRGAGVTQVDFGHMLAQEGLAGAQLLLPGRHNTALAPEPFLGAPTPSSSSSSLGDRSTRPARSGELVAARRARRGRRRRRRRGLHASAMELGLLNPDDLPRLRLEGGAAAVVLPSDGGNSGNGSAAAFAAAAAMRLALRDSVGWGRESDSGSTPGSQGGGGALRGRVGGAASAAARGGGLSQPSGGVLRLHAAELAQALELAGMAGQRVVYLGHPISVDLSRRQDLADKYDRIERGCAFLAG